MRQFSSVQSLDRMGHRGDMKDDSAEIFLQSFLQKALVSSSDMCWDVHSLMLSIQHFLCQTTVSASLQGGLKDAFGEAVMACDMPKPCMFQSLHSCQNPLVGCNLLFLQLKWSIRMIMSLPSLLPHPPPCSRYISHDADVLHDMLFSSCPLQILKIVIYLFYSTTQMPRIKKKKTPNKQTKNIQSWQFFILSNVFFLLFLLLKNLFLTSLLSVVFNFFFFTYYIYS